MTNVDATTLAATAAANASKGWIETADDGFVSMNEGEINEAIQDYLRETYRQKAISRRILTAATKNQMEEAGDDDYGFGVFSDWRGRKYYHACGLSPQGKDMGKGLLMAATPRMLGKHGLRHLKRGVANTWGNGIEKATMAKREAWADEVIASGWLRTVVEGAQAQEDFTWRLADEPLQFLALAADLLAALDSGNPETYFSSVLIGYDATCSGLQILAALTRCASTARLVNVLPREDGERADIYLTLADKCREVCVELVNGMDSAAAAARIGDNTAQGDDWAVFWQDKITRSVTKKPCMVYCYGGKKRTFAGAIREETKAPWKACMWLAALMYDTVLPALLPKAHAFMELLQEVARLLAQHGKPVEFVTANGLPFVQAVEEEESKRVNAEITRGRVQLIITKTTGKLDSRKQMSGVAPNVVHHFDALFLENAVLAFEEAGIDCFATVHDCFYMRAGDWGDETTGGWSILRREFRDTFKGDVVADLWAKLGAASGVEMPEVPEAGDLDLNAVLRSDFLFS